MSVDQNTVKRIARLARLAVDDAQLAPMEGELNAILAWIKKIPESRPR